MPLKIYSHAIPRSCANMACPNRPDEGRFELIEIGDGNVVGGTRPLRLWLCNPCATALVEESEK